MPFSLTISDISVTVNEDDIKCELMKNYSGVEDVIRWYHDGDDNYPMSIVQVDFNSRENLQKALGNGNIVIGGILRRVSPVKEPQCYRCLEAGHRTYDCHREPLNQNDLMNILAAQRK